MRNIKWYTWIGIIFLFVLATIMFVKVFSTIGQMAHSETMSVEVESEEVDHLIQMETETKEAGSLTSVKSIPFTQIEQIDQPIKKWATKEEERFFSEMKEAEVLLDHDASAHFSLQSEVNPLTDDLYNIVISIEQSVDQEDYDHKSMKTFTIDLEEGELVYFDHLTTDQLTPNKLLELLQENSQSDLDNESFLEYYDTLEDIDWTIGKENIVFYIDAKFRSNNEAKITIPLITFYPYLKEGYYSALIDDDMDEAIKQKEEEERKKREKELREKKEALKNEKMVALTFDDGPHPKQTIKILNTLNQFDATATFFALGNNIKQNPEVAKRIIDDGHELANHSMSHANLNSVEKDKAKKEITGSQDVIEEITGEKTNLYRPPYGNFKDNTEKMIEGSNQEIILWSIDTHDWESKNSKKIYQTVKSHTVPGSIILMHDIYPTTADALPKILKYYDEQGYKTVTISELLPYIEDTRKDGGYYGR